MNVFVFAWECHCSTWRQFCSSLLVSESVDWRPVSQPAASQLCKARWWITIHRGESTLPSPANTSCLACLQGELPELLSTGGPEAPRRAAARKHVRQSRWSIWALALQQAAWTVFKWQHVCLLPVCFWGDMQCNEIRREEQKVVKV